MIMNVFIDMRTKRRQREEGQLRMNEGVEEDREGRVGRGGRVNQSSHLNLFTLTLSLIINDQCGSRG